MKPLELTVYPPLSRFTKQIVAWNLEQGYEAYRGISAEMHAPGLLAMQAKRLTEAELAAEFESARCDSMIQSQTGRCWQPLGYTWPMDSESIHDRAQTLLRFATSPHYCEDAA